MKIVYVLPEFVTEKEAGGLATYYDNIARMLADEGHTVTIIVLSDVTGHIGYYPNISVERVHVDLKEINQEIPGSFIRERSRVLNQRVKELQADGCAFDLVQYPNFMALGFDRLPIPSVVRISSYLPLLRAADQEHFDPYRNYECYKVSDYLEEIALLRADAVYGPGETLAAMFTEKTGRKVGVIESPFYPRRNMTGCSRIYAEHLNQKKYILTFGTLKVLKGAKLIGDSVYQLLTECPDLVWVFAGAEYPWINQAGEKIQPSEYIRRNAGEYADRVIFPGKLSFSELYDVIRYALFCVMPSRVDNLPNTCIEAMALGKVVIGTKGASFEQLITDGRNGFLIERENRQMLISTVKKVYSMSDIERMHIGNMAAKRIETMKPEVILNQMLAFYTSVIRSFPETGRQRHYERKIIEKYNEAMKKTGIREAETYQLEMPEMAE